VRIKIVNCFDPIGYELTNYLLNQDAEIIGIDDIDDKQKLFYYEMVGRHAHFTFLDLSSKNKVLRDVPITYEINQGKKSISYFHSGNEKCSEINFEHVQITSLNIPQRVEGNDKLVEVAFDSFVRWLASLSKYSNLPNKMTLFSNKMEGIYLLN